MAVESAVDTALRARSAYVGSLVDVAQEVRKAAERFTAAAADQRIPEMQAVIADLEFVEELPGGQKIRPLLQAYAEIVSLIQQQVLTKGDVLKYIEKQAMSKVNDAIVSLKVVM